MYESNLFDFFFYLKVGNFLGGNFLGGNFLGHVSILETLWLETFWAETFWLETFCHFQLFGPDSDKTYCY